MTKQRLTANRVLLLGVLGTVLLYLVSRFIALTSLPVFADEAIYIRWAQLILHEPSRYAFFPLNDGKPPLFIWMLTWPLSVASDPLWAARAVSVVIGLGQLLASDWLVRRYKGGLTARAVSAAIIIFTPLWFFHHRMALFDASLTLWLSLTLVGLSLISDKNHRLSGIVLAGISWGLALWTKTPALFFAPIFIHFAIFSHWADDHVKFFANDKKQWLERFITFGLAGALGLGIFLILRLQPTFGSLFSRSSDFTFTTVEIIGGNWRTSLDNIGRLIQWLSAYLRPETLSLAAIALIISKKIRLHWLLWVGAAIFAAPLLIFGRTLHPRYFMPVAPFLTLSAALFAEEAWTIVTKKKDSFVLVMTVLIVGFFLIGSLRFILLSYFTPNQTPFVLADRTQYLTEWSSGHGLPQVRQLLLERARRGERTTVVTEGSFGTLPDGLLMYFDRAPEIEHLRIEGLAQYPVKFLPDWVREEAAVGEVWLVVNEHRMEVPDNEVELIARYPRPYGAPELQVYKVLATSP